MVSVVDRCKRALVALLRALAVSYGLALDLNRDSSDVQVRTASEKLLRKSIQTKAGNKGTSKSSTMRMVSGSRLSKTLGVNTAAALVEARPAVRAALLQTKTWQPRPWA